MKLEFNLKLREKTEPLLAFQVTKDWLDAHRGVSEFIEGSPAAVRVFSDVVVIEGLGHAEPGDWVIFDNQLRPLRTLRDWTISYEEIK